MIGRLRTLSPGQQVALAVLGAALLGGLAVSVPRLGNAAMLVASAALVAMLAVLAQWLWQHRHTTDWSNSFADRAPARGGDVRISRLSESIQAAVAGDARAQQHLHDVLAGLASDRLRSRLGIDAHTDPDAARSALGADLAAYLAGPATGPTSRLTADRLARLVTTLEDL
jgi:hypothetical protein